MEKKKRMQILVDCSEITDMGVIDERDITRDGQRIHQERHYLRGNVRMGDGRFTWFGVREIETIRSEITVEDVYVNGEKVTDL